MNAKSARAILPRLLLLALCGVCLGWGRDGHMIVGAIAARHLTPQAHAAVADLLGEQTLADVSTWADEIKSDPAWRWASPMHYANVDPEADGFVLSRDCPQRGCVVSAIHKYTAILRDEDSTRDQRIEALKFLVHFVGDIHQPLHVGAAHDKGGNDIKVEFFHDQMNLHSLWDSGLIRHTKKKWTDYAEQLNSAITPQQLTEWQSPDPIIWANESFKLAHTHAYKIPKDGQLAEEYFNHNIPVVDQRLTMAGIRLAALLNEVFAETEPRP